MASIETLFPFMATAAFMGVLIFVGIVFYVYFAWAFMTIGKKLGYDKSWIAWIPVAQLFLFPILAKKHWALGFLMLIPFVNLVLYIVWSWDIYEQRKYPGWLSLVMLSGFIPVIGFLGAVAHLVIFGLVAWKDR